MNYKEEIKKTLDFLKEKGHDRRKIEEKLSLAKFSLDQSVAREGNEKYRGLQPIYFVELAGIEQSIQISISKNS